MHNSLFDYFFETIDVDGEKSEQSLLVVGASPFRSADDFSNVVSFQHQKYIADQWPAMAVEQQTQFPEITNYDVACVTITKSKEESLAFLRLALYSLKSEGILIAIGANDANGKRIMKWMDEFGLQAQPLSKDKHRIVYAQKTETSFDGYEAEHDLKIIDFEDGQFITIPGIYGWNKIDMGSDLLTEHVPEDLKGKGADFGCGYGFLSKYILKNNSEIQGLDMIDADYRCLFAAEKNMEGYGGKAKLDYQWLDITKNTFSAHAYDFIVMNPPFHEGKKAESGIGIKFIERAAQSLKSRGVLYMVANRHLPYENALNENFSTVEKIAEEDGYKVFRAVK